ncbi:DUF1513 domain-containing protein [Maricurvus nonylphenolicus]|uniref:DUF1513 domain-containing protein n=1 Tax=Maricurvus nonylphenolicus TaxID=1008307 RepID=UPI0036F34CDD
MVTKGFSRRQLLVALGLTSAGVAVGMNYHAFVGSTSSENIDGVLLSAYSTPEGKHFVAGLTPMGKKLFAINIPQRAHDSLFLPVSQQAIFFSRRPGNTLYIVNVNTGELQHKIECPAGRHFYGHGCNSTDGRYLFTTENAYTQQPGKSQQGVIGIYDITDNFRRVSEISSYGIGPHQLGQLSDGKTLVVANGGILTHPLRGREKLNLDTMQPSLAYIDSGSGVLVDQFFPEHHQQSIRHLDIGPDDTVVVGLQFQGSKEQILPLAYRHNGEDKLQPLQADTATWQQHQQYIASVCIDNSGQRLVISSPRGGIASCWNLTSNRLISINSQRDGAGVAFNPTANAFVLSNGQGQLTSLQADNYQRQAEHSYFFKQHIWDNHLHLYSPG